ncbi:MAG: hypothetical protein LBK13_06285 [Spirochaetales bacterium]|jgi:hypothetical protein|nr:hypothetical protein [Spirochaetales bacterium]
MKNKLREAQQARGAQGIAAESPQEAHRRFRGLGAESPVFYGAAVKNALKLTKNEQIPLSFYKKRLLISIFGFGIAVELNPLLAVIDTKVVL